MILGVETSCDETAAALVTDDGHIVSNVVSSQAELHARYGGVVPEVASRRHLELAIPVVREALAGADAGLGDVELVGVTTGPGLIGALLVGVAAANVVTLLSLPKVILGGGLTEALGKPFVSLVRKSTRDAAFPDRCKQVEVVASELEDDAGLIGAALLAREQLA